MSNPTVDDAPAIVVSFWLVIDADVTPEVLMENDPCDRVVLVAMEPDVMVQPLVLSNPSTLALLSNALDTLSTPSPTCSSPLQPANPPNNTAKTIAFRFMGLSLSSPRTNTTPAADESGAIFFAAGHRSGRYVKMPETAPRPRRGALSTARRVPRDDRRKRPDHQTRQHVFQCARCM
jgi:hypothetical protein